MLVLTRRVGEIVKVGEDGAVVVLKNHRGQIRLGFQFPRATRVVRSELVEDKGAAVERCETVVRSLREGE